MANPSFRRYAQQYPHLIDQPRSATTVEQVRQMMFGLLPAGRCSLKTIAHSLGADRQTIHRHLVAAGTTYSILLDEVRSELATRYMREGDRRIAEIGEVLGFSETSVSTVNNAQVVEEESFLRLMWVLESQVSVG
jgi:AraC-like DNA-binding protein